MVENIKIAIVGAGYMAEEHIKAFSDIDDTVIAGIFSRTRSKAENLASKYSIENVCDSIDALYNMTKADLVVIAISELETSHICIKSFEYSWVCLIEKPAGYNIKDAELIFNAAHQSGCRAYVALNRRHYASTRAILDGLKEVDGRRIIHVFDQENPAVALEKGSSVEVVKNWMYANSIHLIDYFRVYGRGDVVSVEPVVRWNPDFPEFVVAKITFSSGDIGIYEGIWNGPGPWAVTITTQQRRWESRPLEVATVQEYNSRKIELLVDHPWDKQFKPGLRLQAEEAIKAVRQHPTMVPSIDEAMESMKLVSEIYA